MAQRNRSGARQAPLSFECERLQVRQGLEDTPMNRIAPQEDADDTSETFSCWEMALLDALEDQNRLLYDILGAVTSLTAVSLAGR